MSIEQLFNQLYESIMCIGGPLDYDDIQDLFIELCRLLNETETDESTWCIGEGCSCTLDGLIVGAYWHFTMYHAGQSSKSYAVLCALGSIFSPGMTELDSDSPEKDVCDSLNFMAENFKEAC